MSDPTSEPAKNSQSEPPTARLLRLRDVVADVLRDADAAHEARVSGLPRGAVTGLESLDREMAGALAPGVHFIHGNAGAGKTAFALQAAAACQCPAMFVTCEMAPAELLRRHTARATKTYLGRLKSGEMTRADAERLTLQGIEAAPDLALVDATTAPAEFPFLCDAAQIVKGDAKHLLIVVDSLHSWSGGLASGLPEYEALNAAVGDLQRLSRRLHCAVLIVSERNRASMKDGGLNAGAGTRKIEYGAETVLDLDRDLDAPEDGAGELVITLRIGKNRHGTAGKKIPLKFHGALQTFREPDTGERCEMATQANAVRVGSRKLKGLD
jgi:replicative DNA helicase